MAKVITISIQKGGSGKTTTSGILAYFLAREGNKVLVVDMDSQGNASAFMGINEEDSEGKSIINAFYEMDAQKYVVPSKVQGIDVLPANDDLSDFTRWLYKEFEPKGKTVSLALFELLMPLQDQYDYILIDTPPSLGEYTVNAFVSTDYLVILAESAHWAYMAIPKILKTVNYAKQLNANLQITGILRTMNDSVRYDVKAFVEMIGEAYPDLVYQTVIKRKASTGRLSVFGFIDNKELKEALDQYEKFYKELKQRMGVTVNV